MRLLCGAALGLCLSVGAQAANTLAVCTDGAPEGFDIVRYQLAVTNDAAGLTIYDQLVQFKPGTTELMPGLAERWEISPDGLTYTFHLRRGVKFHTTPWFTPTRELNADDVLFSMNRLHDKAHPAHGNVGYVYWAGMEMSSLIKSVAKLDDATVRFTLTRPDAPFLSDLAIANIGSIYPAEYGAQLVKVGKLDQFNAQPVGSGPFVFKSYQKDAVIRYTANQDYWGGKPKIDNLIFAITLDGDARAQRLRAGECLVGTGMNPETVAAFANDRNVQIVRSSPIATAYLALNTRRKGLDDVRFREALWLAIDKKTFTGSIYGGYAQTAVSFLPPGIWGHDATLKERRDVERAKQLVKASGYDGREFTLLVASGGNRQRAGELLQADWARVGIKVRVQVMELGEVFKRAGNGEHDLAFLSWFGDNGDPDNFFTPNLSCAALKGGGNKSQWCNPRFDALLDEARKTVDHAKRVALYKQAQRIVYDEIPLIPVVYSVAFEAVNRRVEGFMPNPFNNNDYRAVSVH